MEDSRMHPSAGRGLDLLLVHCAAFADEATARPPAYHRLEEAVGGELARMLVAALAGSRRASRPEYAS